MIRKIIQIDEAKCNGCGICVDACHEGAIGMVEGKAKLMRDDYCDGLGDCLPTCPTGAITFVEREAVAYNEAAVLANRNQSNSHSGSHRYESILGHGLGCPGSLARTVHQEKDTTPPVETTRHPREVASQLRQWPVQLKLVPTNAPYFQNANLLVAADCSAFAHGDFHNQFMKNKITLIGCPKLDEGDYSEKLTAILANNEIKSVTVVRMEVPCCGGIQYAVMRALQDSGKMIPWQVITLSADGEILE